MLKDLLYIGMGGALLARERVEEELQKLIEKGKISQNDAKELVESAKNRAKEEEERVKKELKESLREAIDELGLATKADIEELKKLIKGE